MNHSDVAIIGGGIIGLASAYQLQKRFPDTSVAVFEKEHAIALHQTGRNSGVLHSGIYYQPGSLKAINCRNGRQAMVDFCASENLNYDVCGKVIVATSAAELPALERILERGKANGVACELIDGEALRALEPHAAGVGAIHVPDAGIVNYRQVSERLARIIREAGGEIHLGAAVRHIRVAAGEVVLQTSAGDFTCRHLVNCGGLHSDRIARMAGIDPKVRIVPFRGEYFELEPEAQSLCRNLIYPVPDPRFPFLGVHFTRMIDGGVECGPNAVLAFAREGYRWRDVVLRDLAETIVYGGFRRMAANHWKMGMEEIWRSMSKGAFVKALQRLVPEVSAKDLRPAPAGVRAQALAPDGRLVDDFLIIEQERALHVCNAPSPAATASLTIGQLVVDRLAVKKEGCNDPGKNFRLI